MTMSCPAHKWDSQNAFYNGKMLVYNTMGGLAHWDSHGYSLIINCKLWQWVVLLKDSQNVFIPRGVSMRVLGNLSIGCPALLLLLQYINQVWYKSIK